LDFSKIEAQAMELELQEIDLTKLIQHTCKSLEQLAIAKSISLNLELLDNWPKLLWIDPVRLRQVLTNLIGNAIKFTSNGSVTVRVMGVQSDHAHVFDFCIQVIDTGIGFDPERTEALFSPFTQADGSVTRSFGGTGLGLAISRSLLQLMSGTISAQGQPGQGATFTIQLPLKRVSVSSSEQSGLTAQSADLPDSSSTFKPQDYSVLLAEDHEINRKLAEILLQRMGFRYVIVPDGQQALDQLAAQRFDVVLMDVMMPVMDGLSALRRYREMEASLSYRTPVLMVTAHAMTGDRERYLAEGADGYVSKPMSQAVLIKEIRRVLEQRYS
jgi:CheY-like chemotaxis protein/anti-sigma regulatory factor (Ser/Thr protein kinase)